MSISYSLLTSAYDTYQTDSSITTSSFTPSNSSLLVVLVSYSTPDGTGTPSITDSVGLTWTRNVWKDQNDGWGGGVIIYTAPVSTGSSMTITVDTDANGTSADVGGCIQVVQITGHDTSTPVANTFSDGANSGRSGAWSGTLSSAPDSTSIVIVTSLIETYDGIAGATPGTGWTAVGEQAAGVAVQSSEYRTSSTSTSLAFNLLTSEYLWAVGAVEIAAASEGSYADGAADSSGVGSATGTTSSLSDATGGAASTGSATGMASALADATTSASSTSSATGNSSSYADAYGSASATSSATGITEAEATVDVVGSVEATSAATGTTESYADAIGNCTSAASATGSAESYSDGIGGCSGASSATGVTLAYLDSTASATATSDATGATESYAGSDASSTGSSDATGTTASYADANSNATGASESTGVTESYADGIANATGASDATGVSTTSTDVEAAGSSTGSAAATAHTDILADTDGSAYGISYGTGVAESYADADADSSATSEGTGRTSDDPEPEAPSARVMPAGGAGGGLYVDPRKLRKKKNKQTHVIKVGKWPSDEDRPQREDRAVNDNDSKYVSSALSRLDEDDLPSDDDEFLAVLEMIM